MLVAPTAVPASAPGEAYLNADTHESRMAESVRQSGVPYLRGVAAGVGAYLLGYFVVYLVTASTIRNSVAAGVLEFLTGEPGTWKLVGWVLYSAHFVDVLVPGLLGGSNAVSLIDAAEAIPGWLRAVPVVLLVGAGVALALGDRTSTVGAGARAGAAVVLGYLPLAAVGAFVFTIRVGEATARPDLVPAVGVAGVVYPLVFGALGGALAAVTRSWRGRSSG